MTIGTEDRKLTLDDFEFEDPCEVIYKLSEDGKWKFIRRTPEMLVVKITALMPLPIKDGTGLDVYGRAIAR